MTTRRDFLAAAFPALATGTPAPPDRIDELEARVARLEGELTPVWFKRYAAASANTTITTSETVTDTVTVDPPVWVNELALFCLVSGQFTESTSDQNVVAQVRVAGVDYASREQTTPNNQTTALATSTVRQVTDPADTIDVSAVFNTNDHNSTSNSSFVVILAVGVRRSLILRDTL